MSGRRKRQKGRERIERVVDHLGPLRRKVTWDFRTGRYLASEHNKPSERGENCRGGRGKSRSEENRQSKVPHKMGKKILTKKHDKWANERGRYITRGEGGKWVKRWQILAG